VTSCLNPTVFSEIVRSVLHNVLHSHQKLLSSSENAVTCLMLVGLPYRMAAKSVNVCGLYGKEYQLAGGGYVKTQLSLYPIY